MKRLLYLSIFYPTVILSILSCQGNNKKAEITEIVKAWQGKEIVFPADLVFTKHGKDTIDYTIPASFEAFVIRWLSSVWKGISFIC